MWHSWVEIKHYSVHILTALSRQKHCSTELLLRARIYTALVHGHLITLHSTYEPRPQEVLGYSASNAVAQLKYTME